ncbi:MAG: DUF1634 domain-containing protein [Thermomicrobiales bacterium]
MNPNIPVEDQTPAASRDDLAPLYAAAVRSLQTGFRLGAALLAVGLVWAAIAGESLGREVDAFDEILPSLRDGHARGLIDLAILCFMATPVATVVVVTRGFSKIGDRTFTLLSSVVLAILAVSIALSIFE